MNVILFKEVDHLGKVGDVVKVKDGFARNFLFPKKMAYAATAQNLRRIEQQKAKQAALEAQKKKAAEELAEKLNRLSCTVTVEVNDLDKLYGSVAEADVVKALEVEGFSIDHKAVVLEKTIDELGIYDVGVKLHPEVMAKIRLWVAKK